MSKSYPLLPYVAENRITVCLHDYLIATEIDLKVKYKIPQWKEKLKFSKHTCQKH